MSRRLVVLLAITPLATLACEGGDEDHYCKHGPQSDLIVLIKPADATVTITTAGACTQVEFVERDQYGSVWRGRMLRVEEPCTVTVRPANGTPPMEHVVRSTQACGAPSAAYVDATIR